MSYVVPMMTRCTSCRRWWCKTPQIDKCACGSELEYVDMDAHLKTVKPAVAEKPPS